MSKKIHLAALLLALMAMAATAGEGDDKKSGEKQATAVTSAGMVYTTEEARGPNGELPTELREALTEMVNTSSDGLTEVQLEDGTVMVDLKGRFQSAMVVTIGEDGKMKSGCYSSVPGHQCSAEHKAKVGQEQKEDKAPPK